MGTPLPFSGSPEFDRDACDERVFKLAKYRHVPDDVLAELVTLYGHCFWQYDRDDMPESSGDDDADRRLAAFLCDGCPVQDVCLELELRAAGEHTVGVWGGLSEQDRRRLYPIWRWHRDNPPEETDGDVTAGGEW